MVGAGGQVGCELRSVLGSLAVQLRQPRVVFSDRSDLDLTDLLAIPNYLDLVSPDIIVNASAYTAVDKAESQSDLAFLVNGSAVKELALFCKERKSILIHISTDYVFDGLSDRPYVESDQVAPSGVYGGSKLAGERAIGEILEEYIILRTSWVFGVGGSNFVKTMLRLAKEKEELGVVADQRGAPTSARAIATSIAEIIRQIATEPPLNQRWGTYHYSGFPYVSWAEFAREIFKQATSRGLTPFPPKVSDISTADYPTPAVRPANSKLDCSKLQSTFGIEPDDWKRSLGLMLDELKEEIHN